MLILKKLYNYVIARLLKSVVYSEYYACTCIINFFCSLLLRYLNKYLCVWVC